MSINLTQLIEEGQPIYVYNRTGNILEQQSPFILEIKDNNGKAWPVPIPATKYPFLISGHVPPSVLAESMEIRNAIRKGILELVDPEEGDRIMQDPSVQKAMAATMRRFQPTTRRNTQPSKDEDSYAERYLPPNVDVSASYDARSEEVINKLKQDAPLKVADTSNREAAVTENDTEVLPKISQIVWDANRLPDNAEDAIVELSSLELTSNDFGYIIKEAEVSTLKSWAKAELAKIAPKRRRRKTKGR